MVNLKTAAIATAAAFFLSGCNGGKAIDSASQKSLVGNGYIAINKITITDPTTNAYTPQIFSLIMSGKYVSLLKDSQILFYDKKSSAAILNSNAVTTEENLIIQVKNGTVADVLAELAKMHGGNATAADGKQAETAGE